MQEHAEHLQQKTWIPCINNQNKKDVEYIAHYRRLAKSDTREEFEKYRNSNYKKENNTQLSVLVKRDIIEYEQKLKI